MNTQRFIKFNIFILFLFIINSANGAINFFQSPLFLAATEPRVLLLLSRDHQLSMKAYTDYTDLDGDGSIDTTYLDRFAYYGYFDSNKCYNYNNSRFEPVAAATGRYRHSCNGYWSGNFLNWATMTRMDVLRKTLYGGYRSTDTVGTGYETVLERQFLPVDVHAFVKVSTESGSLHLSDFIPSSIVGSNTSISLCNATPSTKTNLTGLTAFMDPKAGVTTNPAPIIRVAAGAWPQWDASEISECAINTGYSTQPTTATFIGDYIARVKVCDSSIGLESNCKTYTNPSTGVQTIKPTGLLQQYGDADSERLVRFGLMSGTFAKNKSGAALRKNIGFIANNQKANITSSALCGNDSSSLNEIDACTGQFINSGSDQAGIINFLNRVHIAGFQYTGSSGYGNGKHQYICNTPGITSFTNGQCVDWGNPLSEGYLEALRYFTNSGKTSTFDPTTGVVDASILQSIPQVTWSDPLPKDEWCALSTIIVVSTGLNSFDTDELASFGSVDPTTLTNSIGDASHENINGGSYFIGDNGSTANNQCTPKTITNLSTAKGVCPQVPSLQGGYGLAGLAYAPKTKDLRSEYLNNRKTRWESTSLNWALRQPINTYTVQLGEALPSFSPSVGTGTITLLPACQANSNGSIAAWSTGSTGWRNCSMTNLVVDTNVDVSQVGNDSTAKTKTCSGQGTTSTSQCFTITWEDSTWGNDYDMDGIQRLGYCVGTACSSFKMLCPTTSNAAGVVDLTSTTVADNQMVVATCAVQAQAGDALTFGYTVTGSTVDGASFPILRPGGSANIYNNFNVSNVLPSAVTAPSKVTFTQGTSSAKLLQDPLWYAAKYGGFTEKNDTANPNPNLIAEWDTENSLTGAPGADGVPDAYFNVRNPSLLLQALAKVFDRASSPDASAASVATNSTNLRTETRVYQGKFSSYDWSGQLLCYRFSIDGSGQSVLEQEWDSGVKINSQSATSRVVLTKKITPNIANDVEDGVKFDYDNLGSTQKAALDLNPSGTIDHCGSERVAYLRGDGSQEGDPGELFTCASGTTINDFRTRETSKLGDIVNSNPWYIGAPAAGFSDVDYPGYRAFREAHLKRKPVVYIGANDGMLHGFDASMTINEENPQGLPTANSGQEVLAYIPTEVYQYLNKLTGQTYNRKDHHYFVDGSPMGGDAYLTYPDSSKNWRTVLIGGLNAGGKGYYALDVSDPGTFSETGSSPADTLLWEFQELDDPFDATDDPLVNEDVGYVYNLPPISLTTNQAKQIVKLANRRWAVILGNGYGSISGKAVLYVLFIDGGIDGTWAKTDYVKLVADIPLGKDNGLSTPVPFDSNDDGYADTVYAGDLKGNMWKFLIGPQASDSTVTSDPSTWKVAFSVDNCQDPDNDLTTPSKCVPLFTAIGPDNLLQQITTPPEVTGHPQGGQLILFGTGKYLEWSDRTSTGVQSFYGIWDQNDKCHTKVLDRLHEEKELLKQEVTNATYTAGTFRIPSANAITWRAYHDVSDSCSLPSTDLDTYMGWYLDLPGDSGFYAERVTGVSKLINQVIFFNTFLPSEKPCESGGQGYLMALDYASGGQVQSHQIFDTDKNGVINKNDALVGGYKIGAALGGTTMIQNTQFSGSNSTASLVGTNIGAGVSSMTNSELRADLINFGTPQRGRTSWREIVPRSCP